MLERAIVPLVVVFICAQTRFSFDTQASPVPADAVKPIFYQPGRAVDTFRTEDSKNPRDKRQVDIDDNDIDVDGPYGYIPRVVHGVGKIVKGLLNGSMHSVFHGAFGIAPDDVSEDLIGTYNQIFGIPDPDDLSIPERVRKPKPRPKPTAAATLTNGTATATSEASASIKDTKNSKDEEEDDEDLDEDDDK